VPRRGLRFANGDFTLPGMKWAAMTQSVGRVLARHIARSPAVVRVLAVSASFVFACSPPCPAAAVGACSTAAASEGLASGCDSDAADRVDAAERVEDPASPAGSADGLCAGAAAALTTNDRAAASSLAFRKARN
jgi:hypothetical protein